MRWVGAKGSWSDSEEWEGCDGQVEVGKTVVIKKWLYLVGKRPSFTRKETP